jgi:hypothetical protein
LFGTDDLLVIPFKVGPGVRYEIGVAISTGHIVSFHGPFPCGEFPDLKFFRLGMKNQLGPGEKVIADDGYIGETKVCTKHDARDEQHRRVIRCIWAHHATINRRLKTWKSLQSVYRHDRKKHHLIFESVLVLEQLAIENGHEPFQVHCYVDSAFVG